ITNWFKTDVYKLRLHTWFKTHFDYMAVDTSPDEEVFVQEAPLLSANLYWKGPSVQIGREGAPALPDFYTTANSPCFHEWEGNFTRYGDVLPLLTQADDKFVIMHAGDAVEMEFDALPSLGMERDYMVFTDAFYKEDFVHYLLGQEVSNVEPLPFHGMPYYPYPDTMSYPYDEEHILYLNEYNTRQFNKDYFDHHNTIYTDYVKLMVLGDRKVTNLDTGEKFDTIQEAIDDPDTSDGHTLLVNASNDWYDGVIWVNKSITIMGEDRDFTKIDAWGGFGFKIQVDWVNISGFTIVWDDEGEAGIFINNSNHCNISNNNLSWNYVGVWLNNSDYNTIYNNEFYENTYGILLNNSGYNVIEKNDIRNSEEAGIYYTPSETPEMPTSWNEIKYNNISNNYYGIELYGTDNETIYDNEFYSNDYAVYLTNTNDSNVSCNKMMYNTYDGVVVYNCSNITVEHNDIKSGMMLQSPESYSIYVKTVNGWELQKELHFFKNYETVSLDLSNVLPDVDGECKVRIMQHGGIAAHIDYVALFDRIPFAPASAICINDGSNVLHKILHEDNDVADAWEKTIEVTWDKSVSSPTLLFRANEEPFANGSPLFTPHHMIPEFMMPYTVEDNGVITIDGVPDTLSSPDFSSYWMPTSGHPKGFTYVWLRSDGEYLYATMEITSDNTYDDTGWGSLYIYANGDVKEFKIDSSHHEYGREGFVYTAKVSWQHMVYEFKIPLSEIGISLGDTIKIGYGSYGTLEYERSGISIIGGKGHTINNNTISNYTYGIYLSKYVRHGFMGIVYDVDTPDWNNITSNTIYNNSGYGIYVDAGDNNTIFNNKIFNNSYGIYLDKNVVAGMLWYIYGVYTPDNNTIANNTIYNHTDYGIYIDAGDNNTIINNTIYNNSDGIYLDKNVVEEYDWMFGYYYVYDVYTPDNNTIANNVIYNNSGYGIIVLMNGGWGHGYGIYIDAGDNNTIINNTIYNNSNGIYLDKNVVYEEEYDYYEPPAEDGSMVYGVYTPDNNIIANNTIYNNVWYIMPPPSPPSQNGEGYGYGIYIDAGDNNTIVNNIIFNNSDGIYLDKNVVYGGYDLGKPAIDGGIYGVYTPDNNTIANNTIYNHTDYGIYIDAGDN
ncbi:MAG: hypothetical protein DRN12_07410, partial [Thermoplasmata archaeon]